MALATTAAGAPMAGAQFAGAVTEEALQNAVLDQHAALGFHALIVHGQRSEGSVADSFIDRGHGGMGDQLAHLVGEGGGAPLHLGGFQQMAAGFVENHTAEPVGKHHRELSRFDVIRVQHGGRTGAEVDGGGLHIPVAQIVGVIGGAVATAQARPVIAISR